MKVLFVTNIPVPYRIDFYNELGKMVDLTVVFEAKGAEDQGIRFNYNLDQIENFKAVFLSDGNIKEKKINWKILNIIREKYDRIVLTSYSYVTEMILLIYLKIKRIPYYLSSDGGLIKYNEKMVKKKLKTFLISGAKGYFSPSDMADEYLMYYGADKNVIYRYPFTSYKKKNQLNEIIDEGKKRRLKDCLGIEQKYMILGVGQFIYRKGWDILLNAMEGQSEEIAVCIIGGEVTEEYKRIVKEKKLNNIYFKKFMSNENLTKYYKAADLFVLPTREDIWGLVINEAMNYGLPVITTNMCVAGRELVSPGRNGYLISDIRNTNSIFILKNYIKKVLYTQNLKEKFAIESLRIIRDYSIENMVTSYYNILKE